MTTAVTVKTVDWPVEATLGSQPPVTVPPNTERTFHIHAGTDILFKELPK